MLIRKGFATEELMVCLVLNGDVKKLKAPEVLVERLVKLFPSHMASISCSINREKTNVIMGKEIVNLYGPGYITDYIGNVCYRISPLSFYQVNPVQTQKLHEVRHKQPVRWDTAGTPSSYSLYSPVPPHLHV